MSTDLTSLPQLSPTPSDTWEDPSAPIDISAPPTVTLELKDGTTYMGYSFGADVPVAGEVCFNTGMVGYPESLTDPSYSNQILVLTYPLVGNYGVPPDDTDPWGLSQYFESNKIHVSALVVCDYSPSPSHWRSQRSLRSWLRSQNIPAIFGVDTRALAQHLRDNGSTLGRLCFPGAEAPEWDDPNSRNLVATVSPSSKHVLNEGGSPRILTVDMGMKHSIARLLLRRGAELTVVPWDHDITAAVKEGNYDGIFLTNGPGDPALVDAPAAHMRALMADPAFDIPVFGVCMGCQVLALAAGAKTVKMAFGNRGMNQPVVDLRTSLSYITSQNHGYAVDATTLPQSEWVELFRNANDGTCEGFSHRFRPFSAVQFHPEARAGPLDTEFLFDDFLMTIKERRPRLTTLVLPPRAPAVRRLLLLGSGGLSIGQAGEFDYSGSQAIKAFKEDGVYVILVNPNIATVQTSHGLADSVYFHPITPDYVESIIAKEKPDSIVLQFGGQTALNCGLALDDSGVLTKYNVRVLGTPTDTIRTTEDRELFARALDQIGEKVAPSATATSVAEAVAAATEIGYPVLVRTAFALGGLGSGFAEDEPALLELLARAFASSPQVIIDKSLRGWKEVEYEVARDSVGNCVAVCSMENFDPLGIHTGDSIVVAPSQTLSNEDYFRLRAAALKIVGHLGVVGECNVQYAVDPVSDDYCVIEVNARLSRSSALASKATGYPLAYVAAKLALGRTLPEVKNKMTQVTAACFEPALDYVVVKIPRWDTRKFSKVSTAIGSAMKSVGEVMAIGRSFEETLQKAMRMLDDSIDGFSAASGPAVAFTTCPAAELEEELRSPSDRRLFAVAAALHRNYTVSQISAITAIDPWFLSKLRRIVAVEHALAALPPAAAVAALPIPALRRAKQAGFSDRQLARALASVVTPSPSEADVRAGRLEMGIVPSVKQVDTLAAEIPAQSNYLYLSYNGEKNDVEASAPLPSPTVTPFDLAAGTGEGTTEGSGHSEGSVIVLGCGAYRIGSSCEFDWCAVSCVRAIRAAGIKAVVINFNPETVSTDYDESDRLYFEELTLERVLDIYRAENARGIVVSVGGQLPNNLAGALAANGVRILGTPADMIDMAENRANFSGLLDSIGVEQPAWSELADVASTRAFAADVGFPVLVRPSYVLSGAAMNVARSEEDLMRYLDQASGLGKSALPVVVSKFVSNAKEIEYDAVACNGHIINFAISEHIENAGVHSGDATLVLPAQKLYVETLKRVRRTAALIARRLNVTGPFNIQFMARDNDVLVIECNLRASRSFPFVSKTFNVDFIALATRAMLGLPVKPAEVRPLDIDHVCVKAPVFSFARLQGADPVLRVEMASTGEVAAFGVDVTEAYTTALLAANFKLPAPGSSVVISAGPLEDKVDFLPAARALAAMGYRLLGTAQTAAFYSQHGIQIERVEKPASATAAAAATEAGDEQQTTRSRGPSDSGRAVLDVIRSGSVGLVFNIPNSDDTSEVTAGYRIRRAAVDFGVPLMTNLKTAILLVEALTRRFGAAPARRRGGCAPVPVAAAAAASWMTPKMGPTTPAFTAGSPAFSAASLPGIGASATSSSSSSSASSVKVRGIDGKVLPPVRSWAEVMLASGLIDPTTH